MTRYAIPEFAKPSPKQRRNNMGDFKNHFAYLDSHNFDEPFKLMIRESTPNTPTKHIFSNDVTRSVFDSLHENDAILDAVMEIAAEAYSAAMPSTNRTREEDAVINLVHDLKSEFIADTNNEAIKWNEIANYFIDEVIFERS